ncbi:MAG: hypothetical protein HYY17_11205 [Planctomycetes bacterium]|nr:hypothetical protein [Planctomycetota bacterium]
MARVNLQRTIVVYLAWLGFIGTGLVLVLSDIAPVLSAYVRPENLYNFLLYSELFFVLALWPLFIPRILSEDREAPPVTAESGQALDAARGPADRAAGGGAPQSGAAPCQGQVHILMLQVVLLFVFVLPLAFICQNISNLGLWTFFKGQLQVAVLACFVAALFSLAADRKWRAAPAYYLGFFLSCAGLPFLYYLVLEFTGAPLGFLGIFSPFWAASRLDAEPTALIQCAIFGAAAVGLLLGPAFLKKTQSAAA